MCTGDSTRQRLDSLHGLGIRVSYGTSLFGDAIRICSLGCALLAEGGRLDPSGEIAFSPHSFSALPLAGEAARSPPLERLLRGDPLLSSTRFESASSQGVSS